MRYKYAVPFIFLFFLCLETIFALSYDQVEIMVNNQVITKNEIELRALEIVRQIKPPTSLMKTFKNYALE